MNPEHIIAAFILVVFIGGLFNLPKDGVAKIPTFPKEEIKDSFENLKVN